MKRLGGCCKSASIQRRSSSAGTAALSSLTGTGCRKWRSTIDVEKQNDKTANISTFVEKAKKFTAIKELTPSIVHEFIDYIMVSSKQVIDGKTVYPIDIYYNGVGILNVPTAEELEEMFQERRKQKRSKEQKTA